MTPNPFRARRERREAALADADRFRTGRRLLVEDVTVLGEELAELHVETLTDVLSADARDDYSTALDRYDRAKAALAEADDLPDLAGVESELDDGRFAIACVLARRDGRALPQRRDPCFFNPQHGPASRDVPWTPPGGVERAIAICFRCAQRLDDGEAPDHRLVRVGDRWVPWYAAGSAGSKIRDGGISAHLVRGDGFTSRTYQAQATLQASLDLGSMGGGGSS